MAFNLELEVRLLYKWLYFKLLPLLPLDSDGLRWLEWKWSSIPRKHGLKCVGPGWKDLINECYDLCEAESPPITVSQIKEKFGGLRFYTGPAKGGFFDEIDAIADRSYRICEVCGEPGKPTKGGWIKTLCPACLAIRDDTQV